MQTNLLYLFSQKIILVRKDKKNVANLVEENGDNR